MMTTQTLSRYAARFTQERWSAIVAAERKQGSNR